MIEDVNKYLVGLVIAIRFGPKFSVEDNLGKIVDSILYSKDAYFNPTMFPRVLSDGEKRLYNESSSDSLRVNARGIILEIYFEGQKKVDDIPEILDRFHRDIVTGILKEFKINRIARLGFIRKYRFCDEELSKTFVSKVIGSTLDGVNDLNLRFAKKYMTQEAMTKKGVNDYNNVIYSITKKIDSDDLLISVDYQSYYDPPLETASQIDFPVFLKRVETYNSENFLKWFNSFYE